MGDKSQLLNPRARKKHLKVCLQLFFPSSHTSSFKIWGLKSNAGVPNLVFKMGLEEEEQHICAICHQEITGGAMRTRNKLYCEDSCFNCSACQRSLKNVSVFTKDDLLYCEEHYKAKFVPKCAKCDDYITEVSLRRNTLFENHLKCLIFFILAFSTNFCPNIIDISGNTVRLQASGFQNLAKIEHFGHF